MKKTPEPKPTATPPAAAPATPAPAVAPQPKMNLMKVDLSRLSAQQDEEVHDALLAQLLQRFAAKSTRGLQDVLWYVEILETDSGCDTPAENFITQLVMVHALRGLTPDDVDHDLKDFRLNFDDMAIAAAEFTARYPEAVKSATAA
jgi:hypothetical protein